MSEPSVRLAPAPDPTAWARQLAYRADALLPFDPEAIQPGQPVMLDSCAYIDAAKGLVPSAIEFLIQSPARPLWHCVVCRAELAAGAAKLPLADPRTPAARRRIQTTLDRMPPGRIAAPSAAAWDVAGVLAGILGRTQGLAKGAHVRLLQDAAILLAAEERGAVLVTGNVSDFDLLLQLRPSAQVILYRTVPVIARGPAIEAS